MKKYRLVTTVEIQVDDDGSVRVLSQNTEKHELVENNRETEMAKTLTTTLTEGNHHYGILALGTKHGDFMLPLGTKLTVRYGKPGDSTDGINCNTHNTIKNRINGLTKFYANYHFKPGMELKLYYIPADATLYIDKIGEHSDTTDETGTGSLQL